MDRLIANTRITIRAEFRNEAGALADPTTIILYLESPEGTITDYSYAEAEVIRESIGVYYMLFTPTLTGQWAYEWRTTGSPTIAKDGLFVIEPSEVG